MPETAAGNYRCEKWRNRELNLRRRVHVKIIWAAEKGSPHKICMIVRKGDREEINPWVFQGTLETLAVIHMSKRKNHPRLYEIRCGENL